VNQAIFFNCCLTLCYVKISLLFGCNIRFMSKLSGA